MAKRKTIGRDPLSEGTTAMYSAEIVPISIPGVVSPTIAFPRLRKRARPSSARQSSCSAERLAVPSAVAWKYLAVI